MSVSLIPQIQNGCVLACLQSFLSDTDPSRIQSIIVTAYPDLCHEGKPNEGSVHPDEMATFFQNLGLESQEISLDAFPPELSNRETLLIGPQWVHGVEGKMHCVRYAAPIDDDEFWVMDPAHASGLQIWKTKWLQEWKCRLFRLRMP